MKYQRKIKLVIFAVVVLSILFLFMKNHIIVFQKHPINVKYGIIDGELSCAMEDIVYGENTCKDSSSITHGDKMIEFVRELDNDSSFFYYDASDSKGNIKTEQIINGLNWMVENGVKYVSVSLSSSYYSEELDVWFSEHKDDICVYASYSNRMNSFDYPAMYKSVVGVGCNTNINYKNIDYHFRTNKVVILPNVFYSYEGNSFLAPFQMLKDIEKDNVND